MKFLSRLRVTHSAGAGSAYIAVSFGVSGALTFAFQSVSTHVLGKTGFAPLALVWSATFLTVQVLWVGATQTLGRYVAEREARGEDWRPIVVSVRRWQVGLSGVFVLGALLASPVLTNLFGSVWLTVQIVAESAGRVLIAVVLLAVGWGVFGPALAIVLAPLIGVLAVRPAHVPPPTREGQPFSTGHALQFAAPVLACMAFAQTLMNGGPILADVIGGTKSQVSLFAAALIFTRIPQYVLSPAIGALLPRASRVLSTDGRAAFERFLLRVLGIVGLVGILMVGGTWLLGGWGLRLFAGEEFMVERSVLVALAAMAAFYLLSETVSQSLFALGCGRLAALGWFVGLLASAACLVTLGIGVVERVSYSLAVGTFAAAVAQAALYLALRRW